MIYASSLYHTDDSTMLEPTLCSVIRSGSQTACNAPFLSARLAPLIAFGNFAFGHFAFGNFGLYSRFFSRFTCKTHGFLLYDTIPITRESGKGRMGSQENQEQTETASKAPCNSPYLTRGQVGFASKGAAFPYFSLVWLETVVCPHSPFDRHTDHSSWSHRNSSVPLEDFGRINCHWKTCRPSLRSSLLWHASCLLLRPHRLPFQSLRTMPVPVAP
jgi:hypothetical protein